MAEGILGLGSGASSLSNELIDTLKEAERASTVAPIETSIEEIDGEGGESEKIQEITNKVNELLETIKPFDLFVTGGLTAFDSKTANATGSSVVFDAVDASLINEGTTKVHIDQLAQRDVFQTDTFSDAEALISPISFVLDGESFETDSEDFSLLATEINANPSFTASFDSETSELIINNGNGDVTFDTTDKSYRQISREIDNHISGNFSSSVPNTMMVLSQSSRPVYQSDEKVSSDSIIDASGGTLTIDGEDFDFTGTTTYSELIDSINENEDFSAKITILGRLEITHSDKETALSITGDIATDLGISIGEKYSTAGISYEQLAENIDSNSNYNSTVETVGANTNRIVIKSVESGTDNSINITQINSDLGFHKYESTTSVDAAEILTNGKTLILDGITFTTAGDQSYDSFISDINNHADFSASIEDGKVLLSRIDGSDIDVTTDVNSLDLGFSNINHTVRAQNLEAEVDGIAYNVSSNVLVVDGGLKITAVEVNNDNEYSTIAVDKDTTSIEPALQDFVTVYNELVSLVDEELYSSESNIDDKASLRSMMSSIKDKLFGSYGPDNDLNVFNFGFEIDKTGVLSLDSETFNKAIETDVESLKSLFVGVADEDGRGLGTQLKEYVDALDGFDGLLYTYQTNMDARKESLEEEKEKAIDTLDNKYSLLSTQFAAYNTLINEFETQFSSLLLMIEQSVASS